MSHFHQWHKSTILVSQAIKMQSFISMWFELLLHFHIKSICTSILSNMKQPVWLTVKQMSALIHALPWWPWTVTFCYTISQWYKHNISYSHFNGILLTFRYMLASKGAIILERVWFESQTTYTVFVLNLVNWLKRELKL